MAINNTFATRGIGELNGIEVVVARLEDHRLNCSCWCLIEPPIVVTRRGVRARVCPTILKVSIVQYVSTTTSNRFAVSSADGVIVCVASVGVATGIVVTVV